MFLAGRNAIEAILRAATRSHSGSFRQAFYPHFGPAAVNGKSRDTDLLMLNPFRGILIGPPATFVQGMARSE
jgi:hypothetical protein